MAEKTKRYTHCFEAVNDGRGEGRARLSDRPIPFHCLNENNVFGESTDFEKEVVLDQGLCYKKHFAGSITAGEGTGRIYGPRSSENPGSSATRSRTERKEEPSAYPVQKRDREPVLHDLPAGPNSFWLPEHPESEAFRTGIHHQEGSDRCGCHSVCRPPVLTIQ